MGELPPTNTLSSFGISRLRLGQLGQAHGLYLNCTPNGTLCRKVVDTGATIFLVHEVSHNHSDQLTTQDEGEQAPPHVGVNVLGLLPTTNQGNLYILVAMDYFTK